MDLWIKVLLTLVSLGIGLTVPVLTYEYRITSLELSREKEELRRFSKEDSVILSKELELQLKDLTRDIKSNRVFIARECLRNNIQDEALKQKPINNCSQEF